MTNLPPWGGELRKYRKAVGFTQGQFIERLSHMTGALSDDERSALESVDIYQEAATYFGGILDSPTLSRLEKGTRTLSLRARILALVWGLRRLGAIQTVEEANQFLECGHYGHLTPAESDAIFGCSAIDNSVEVKNGTGGIADAGSTAAGSADPVVQHSTAARTSQTQRTQTKLPLSLPALLILAGLGVALVVGLGFFLGGMGHADLGQTERSVDNPTMATEGDASQNEVVSNQPPTEPESESSRNLTRDSTSDDSGNRVDGSSSTNLSMNASTGASTDSTERTFETLLPQDITTQLGFLGGDQTVENLHTLDQQGTDNDWLQHIKFYPDDEPYRGYRSYFLPKYVEPSTVTRLWVEMNYRGPGTESQVWTWSLYDWASQEWVSIGDNADLPWWGEWTLLSFAVSGDPMNYIHPETLEIQVQSLANNVEDTMDLDYEALRIEFPKSMSRTNRNTPTRVPD